MKSDIKRYVRPIFVKYERTCDFGIFDVNPWSLGQLKLTCSDVSAFLGSIGRSYGLIGDYQSQSGIDDQEEQGKSGGSISFPFEPISAVIEGIFLRFAGIIGVLNGLNRERVSLSFSLASASLSALYFS